VALNTRDLSLLKENLLSNKRYPYSVQTSRVQMTAFSYITKELGYLLFIHGNHCYTVRQRLGSEHARILNLGFSSVNGVWNFFCSNLDEKLPAEGVGETGIFDNPLFHTDFVPYFEKDSKLNLIGV